MRKSLKVWSQKFCYTVVELFSNWLLDLIPRFLLVTLSNDQKWAALRVQTERPLNINVDGLKRWK